MSIYPAFKRTCDILLSGMAILVLSPLLLPVMIVLKCTGVGIVRGCEEIVERRDVVVDDAAFIEIDFHEIPHQISPPVTTTL